MITGREAEETRFQARERRLRQGLPRQLPECMDEAVPECLANQQLGVRLCHAAEHACGPFRLPARRKRGPVRRHTWPGHRAERRDQERFDAVELASGQGLQNARRNAESLGPLVEVVKEFGGIPAHARPEIVWPGSEEVVKEHARQVVRTHVPPCPCFCVAQEAPLLASVRGLLELVPGRCIQGPAQALLHVLSELPPVQRRRHDHEHQRATAYVGRTISSSLAAVVSPGPGQDQPCRCPVSVDVGLIQCSGIGGHGLGEQVDK